MKNKGKRNYISNAILALKMYIEDHGELTAASEPELHKKVFEIIKPAIVRGSGKSSQESTNLAESLISKFKERGEKSRGIRMSRIEGMSGVKLVIED